jgi:hypothetical protein
MPVRATYVSVSLVIHVAAIPCSRPGDLGDHAGDPGVHVPAIRAFTHP